MKLSELVNHSIFIYFFICLKSIKNLGRFRSNVSVSVKRIGFGQTYRPSSLQITFKSNLSDLIIAFMWRGLKEVFVLFVCPSFLFLRVLIYMWLNCFFRISLRWISTVVQSHSATPSGLPAAGSPFTWSTLSRKVREESRPSATAAAEPAPSWSRSCKIKSRFQEKHEKYWISTLPVKWMWIQKFESNNLCVIPSAVNDYQQLRVIGVFFQAVYFVFTIPPSY